MTNQKILMMKIMPSYPMWRPAAEGSCLKISRSRMIGSRLSVPWSTNIDASSLCRRPLSSLGKPNYPRMPSSFQVESAFLYISRGFVTAAQKRALNKSEIGGGTGSTAKSPTQVPPTAPPPGASPAAGSAAEPIKGESTGILSYAIAAAALVAGGYGAFQLGLVPESVQTALGVASKVGTDDKIESSDEGKPPEEEAKFKQETATDDIDIGAPSDGVSVGQMQKLGFQKSITDPNNRPDVCIKGPSHPIEGNKVQGIEIDFKAGKEAEIDVTSDLVDTMPVVVEESSAEPSTAKKTEQFKLDDVKPPPSLGQALKELSSKLAQGSAVSTTKPSSPSSHEAKPSINSVTTGQSRDPLIQKYLFNLEVLSKDELRDRLVQLASEINGLLQFEAIRLQHYQEEVSRQMTREHMEAMHQQKLVLEQVLAEKLSESRDSMDKQLRRALDEKEAEMEQMLESAKLALAQEHEAELQQELAAQNAEFEASFDTALSSKLAIAQAKATADVEEKVQQMEQLQQRLEKVEQIHQISRTYEESSRLAHEISSSALQLMNKLESGDLHSTASVKRDVDSLLALLEGSETEPLLKLALERLPTLTSSPPSNQSLPTVFELQTSFESTIYPTARIAAQVPPGQTSLSAQLFGRLFAALTFPPPPFPSDSSTSVLNSKVRDFLAASDGKDEKTKDDGTDSSTEKYVVTSYLENSRELDKALSMAKHYVNSGELEKAVEILETKVPPTSQVALTLQDWTTQTKQRVAVDQVLQLLKMECAVMNARLKNA